MQEQQPELVGPPVELSEPAPDLISIGVSAVHAGVILGAAALIGIGVHALAFAIARRLSRRTDASLDEVIVRALRGPSIILLPLLTVRVALPSISLEGDLADVVRQVMAITLIVGVTWMIVALIRGISGFVLAQHDITVADNLQARRVHTQLHIISRILSILAIVIGVSTALMTFPAIRQVGASLLASAGLAGLIVGFAARSSIANFIAGVQLALSEPIRLDDVVIVEGEWGRIEEITATYVVVRIWDERRLIVPFSGFLEKPFQNWTRTTAQIIGSVFVHADYTVPVQAVRQELCRIVEETPLWDRRVCVLQVTDAGERSVQLRALVSAADAGKAWDLRCLVREKLISFLQREHPACLPRVRAALDRPGDAGASSGQ